MSKIVFEISNKTFENEDLFAPYRPFYEKFGNIGEEGPTLISFPDVMIDSISRSKKQRHQIIETNLAPLLIGYGKQAEIYSVKLNLTTEEADMLERIYDITNAKDVIDLGIRMEIHYDDKYIDCCWLDFNVNRQAIMDDATPSSFNIFVFEYVDKKAMM